MKAIPNSNSKKSGKTFCKCNKFMAMLIAASCLLWVASCTRIAPLPATDAPPYLKRRGYTPDEIQAIVDQRPLPSQLFEKAASEKSSDVRMLIAETSTSRKHSAIFSCMIGMSKSARHSLGIEVSQSDKSAVCMMIRVLMCLEVSPKTPRFQRTF